jgi:hypothetical protein
MAVRQDSHAAKHFKNLVIEPALLACQRSALSRGRRAALASEAPFAKGSYAILLVVAGVGARHER